MPLLQGRDHRPGDRPGDVLLVRDRFLESEQLMQRKGFTLIEVLIALVILVIVTTTFARFAAYFSRGMANSSIRVIGVGVAADRLELIRADPRYNQLTALYQGDTTGFSGYPTMKRSTIVVRDRSGNPARDFTTITVRVTAPAMRDTVSITAIVASK